ncbi:DUF4097 family beta strand repeat protein [Streptomyces sp. ISL-96]|uniref:DUF4097 family beta strand repeat-containing protein n=1 Tax=Streptomyces sp. ISL-96 TaxID=2819191 RepID=UPI001BE540AD|nr:DUF4097 family beta strand repeat-containing protein [Streptomyces sp. ISL-96]MBT2491924.1 DUF4097 family beta strand repeat protein [Streptomyces sp. ISL-96]
MKLSTRHLTAVAVAVTTGFLFTGCNVDEEGSKSTSSSYEITDKVTALQVKTPGGDIKVVAGDGDTIKVTEKLTYSGDKPKTEHTSSGGTLRLGVGEGCAKDGEASKCKVDYTLEVPKAVAAELDSRGGDVDVTGLAGALDVKAGGGKVTADRLAAKRLTVDANGGAINAEFAAAPETVDINTHSGNVTVQVPSAEAYAVKATSKGGSEKVSVKTDPASSRKITLHTDGGNVQLTSV